MAVHAVRLKRNTDDGTPPYCYVYQRDGDLYHAHKNPASGWSESKFSIRTLDHHLTMYHKDRFYATKSDIPDFVLDRIEHGGD